MQKMRRFSSGEHNSNELAKLEKFTEFSKTEIPDLKAGERAQWLDEHGLSELFKDFQISYWRKRCEELREDIDQINPYFRLAVYPGETLFLNRAVYQTWGTEQAPLIIAPPDTYGRRTYKGRTGKEKQALDENRRIILKLLRVLRRQEICRREITA